VSALKISFGMHFGKSPQHEAPRWGHSFHPSTPTANMATFPQQSAFSCSTTIAPKQTRADRPKAPSKMATRCDPGGLSTENETSRAYTFWSIVGRRAPPLAFRLWREFRCVEALRAQQSFRQSRARAGLAVCRRQSVRSCWNTIGQKSIVWPRDTSQSGSHSSRAGKGRPADRAATECSSEVDRS
jgi:hypothetical protein